MGQVRNQYQIIRSALSEQIETGALAAGAKLPAERQLSEMFGTTRITLREALSSLEADGMVYREDRRGWFVAHERIEYDPTINSNFHTMVAKQRRVPETELIRAGIVPATSKIQKLLELPPLAPVLRLQRIRSVDGRKVLYVENYINPEFFPGLLDHDLSTPLSETYHTIFDIHYHQIQFRVYPVGLHDEAATNLKVTAGNSGLLVNRVNRDQHNRIIDCDFEYWRQDAVVITAQTLPK